MSPAVDLLVVGGGINGVGIARDAAGRGLSVLLVEKNDLGGATSSASSKLIHGGLRYLEQFEFRLVAEALREREILLNAAPHLVRPMRFVMPHVPELRPAWLIRIGLLLYDYLARRDALLPSTAVDLTRPPYGHALEKSLRRGFMYSDCWVDDSRLVISTARAAAQLGAQIRTRTACSGMRRSGASWIATLQNADGICEEISVRAVVNAAGPWALRFLTDAVHIDVPYRLRLVQGSHIVVPKLYAGDHAFILQNNDRRVVFAYPYHDAYTLVGTTDVEIKGSIENCRPSATEVDYLCAAVNRYFCRKVAASDVVHAYAGIRPLFDDGAGNPSQVTRDYALRIAGERTEAPLLSVFGGKITTYRALAEQVMETLSHWFPDMGVRWTATAPLDGGDCGSAGFSPWLAEIHRAYDWLPKTELDTLARRHGSNLPTVLGDARSVEDLGVAFGAGLYAREVDYLVKNEWAVTAEDVLWRRTKCGLHFSPDQQAALRQYLKAS